MNINAINTVGSYGFHEALKSGAEEIIPICITTTYQVGQDNKLYVSRDFVFHKKEVYEVQELGMLRPRKRTRLGDMIKGVSCTLVQKYERVTQFWALPASVKKGIEVSGIAQRFCDEDYTTTWFNEKHQPCGFCYACVKDGILFMCCPKDCEICNVKVEG